PLHRLEAGAGVDPIIGGDKVGARAPGEFHRLVGRVGDVERPEPEVGEQRLQLERDNRLVLYDEDVTARHVHETHLSLVLYTRGWSVRWRDASVRWPTRQA